MDNSFWDSRRGVIRSRKGGWKMGQGVFSHGFNLLEELVGEHSYFQVMLLHATGRMPERRFADWLEAAFICLSWPLVKLFDESMNINGNVGGKDCYPGM
ncbi:MAG: hypothetical protein P8X63_06185 [Desulfuromonadaceae bacterium]